MIQPSFLRRQSANLLQQSSYSPKRLVLLHTVIGLGSFFLTTLINYILNLQISNTGGLAGMELRSALSTVQAVLEFIVTVGLPFWNIGLTFAALRWATRQPATPGDLLQGFRRFRSVLGHSILRTGVFLMLAAGIINICSTIFMLTPFATPFVERLSPLLEQGASAETLITDAFFSDFSQELIPLFVFCAICFALVAIPLFYRLRFSDFALMSGQTCGKALLKSFTITKGRCLQLLKLDLSFWWYYLLLALSILVSYGDVLLPAMGVSLPLSATIASLVFYSLGLVCQGILLWQSEALRLTTYCLAYHTFAGTNADTSAQEAI